MRKRSVWIEPLFGEAKQWHGLRQFRLRGLGKVNAEALLVAAGQNLKRYLAATGWGHRYAPWGALRPPRRAAPRRQELCCAPRAGHAPSRYRSSRRPQLPFFNRLYTYQTFARRHLEGS